MLKVTQSVNNAPVVVDSGATSHFCPDRAKFISYHRITPETITAADSHSFEAIGCGDVRIELPNQSKTTTVLLKNALHAPGMAASLISVAKLDAAGLSALFEAGTCTIKAPDGRMISQIPLIRGLYAMQESAAMSHKANVAVRQLSLAEAHRVLGHISYGAVKFAIKNGYVEGIELDENTGEDFCDACAQAKPI